MKTKLKIALISLPMLLLPGCIEFTPRDIGQSQLSVTIAIVLASVPVILLLTWLAGIRLFHSKILWAQFIALTVIGIGLLGYYRDYELDIIRWIPAIGFVSLPYLFLFTSLAVVLLPPRFFPFLPTLVLIPHFVINILLVLTNCECFEFFVPFWLSYKFWYLMTAVSLCIIGYLAVKKFKNKKHLPPPPIQQQNQD